MENEEITRVEENVSSVNTNEDYIAAIKELKDNSVSKEVYNKLREENKKLLNSLVRGETLSQENLPKKTPTEDLRKKLFQGNLNNLEYIKTAVELRDQVIEEGGRDPFLPWGQKIAPDASDVEAADRVANIFKECIEYADGDSDLFTQELQRRTIDTAPTFKRRK